MVRIKLTPEQVDEARKLLKEGCTSTELAKKYNVDRSTILKRVKYPLLAKDIPIETRNKVFKAIKEGYTKAEAAQMYGLNIGTVYQFTQGIQGYRTQGDHIIRKRGIEYLRRLLQDGYLVSNYNTQSARRLLKHFPMIKTARFKEKTIMYLPGREEQTIEAFFREQPIRLINYGSIEEIAYLLGVKISKTDQKNLVEKYRGKHDQFWKSRMLMQSSLENFFSEGELGSIGGIAEPKCRIMPKRGEW